jgi:hypothetical protein
MCVCRCYLRHFNTGLMICNSRLHETPRFQPLREQRIPGVKSFSQAGPFFIYRLRSERCVTQLLPATW